MGDRGWMALLLLDGLPRIAVLLDAEGRVLEVNRAALDQVRLERDEVLGREFWELDWDRSGEDRTAWFGMAVRAAMSGETIRRTTALPGVGGAGAGSLELSFAPVHGKSEAIEFVVVEGTRLAAVTESAGPAPGRAPPGSAPEIVGSPNRGEDITKRRVAAEALRKNERRYRLLFESMAQGVVYQDPRGVIVALNPAAERILRTSAADLLGQTSVDRAPYSIRADGAPFPGEDHPAMVALRSGQIVRDVLMGVRDPAADDYRWIEITAIPMLDAPGGRPVEVCALFDDITERRRADESLRRYATRLASQREIERAILAIQPAETIAKVALRHLDRLVPCWRGSVAQLDRGGRGGRILTVIGALSRRLPAGTRRSVRDIDAAELRMLKPGKPHVVDDLRDVAGLSEHFAILRDRGARSLVCQPLRVKDALIGAILLFADRPSAYGAESLEIIRETADQVAIALHNARLYEENRAALARLEEVSRRLIRAQEDERRQIARELHDEIGQSLTALKINFQAMTHREAGPDERVTECIAIVDESLQRVRGMALDLRPSLLDDVGLVAALQWYIERHARRTGLEGRFLADPEGLRASPEVETACFRVAQGALTNIARHARARRFSVELRQKDGGLQMVIRDDGRGFDPVDALASAAAGASLGLSGIIERVELVGGEVAFVSSPGHGTEVRVWIPALAPSDPRGTETEDRR